MIVDMGNTSLFIKYLDRDLKRTKVVICYRIMFLLCVISVQFNNSAIAEAQSQANTSWVNCVKLQHTFALVANNNNMKWCQSWIHTIWISIPVHLQRMWRNSLLKKKTKKNYFTLQWCDYFQANIQKVSAHNEVVALSWMSTRVRLYFRTYLLLRHT